MNAMYGGEAAVQQKIASAKAAATKFERTGKADYVPAISRSNKQAAMYGDFDYYLNPKRGAIPQWDNQFAVMSWADWLTFSAMPQAEKIKVPTLFVHSEKAAIPDGARQFFAAIPKKNKQIIWLPNITQFDFYDREPTVDRAVTLTVNYLRQAL
ncbi:hypothetical protein [Chroococcidiopsis sp.]|uniref:hypothetical protein n=1 Tax=Chroococcidiopsis sp. TaxID=3088168 RepID=UPI003F3F8F9F